MSEMVWRAAQAIANEKDCGDIGDCNRDSCRCTRFARVAIEAMREPTAAMMKAGGNLVGWYAYEAMIDAALRELGRRC